MAKSNLYLLQFNQYYNRIVKRFDNLEDYMDYVVYSTEQYDLSHSAFNPNDGVNTKHIINTPDSNYDYLLVVNPENNEIESRWFVTEAVYQRGNGIRVPAQYAISLHRDLMADFFEAVTNATTFIEKATISSTANPLIYNSEGFQCNQIKTGETLLKDATNTPWVVCYVGRDLAKETQQTITTVTSGADTQYEYSLSALRALGTLYGTIQGNVDTVFHSSERVLSDKGQLEPWDVEYNSNRTHSATKVPSNYNIKRTQSYSQSIATGERNQTVNAFANNMEKHQDTLKQQFYNYFSQTNNTSFIYQLQRMSGHLIKDTDVENSYFTFDIRFTNNVYVDAAVPVNSELFNIIVPEIVSTGLSYNASGGNGISVKTKVQTVVVTNIRTSTGVAANLIIPTSASRQHLQDAPYDILCIPYNAGIPFKVTSGQYITSSGIAVNIGQALATLEGGFVYDVQLLPYCPCMEYWDEVTNSFDMTIFQENQHYSIIQTADNAVASIAFWCNKSSFRGQVEFTAINNPTDPVEFKINNECDKYRLVSPNYNGAFDFTLTKNNGLYGFEVNCTYKPMQPYVHVNPIFSGLYGKDFNDERGLVCGGDFSLPRVNDEWVNYQIQNKAYRESFERQITNMETNYQINREHSKTAGTINALTAAISGAGSGAIMGITSGRAPGAAAGAVIGGTVSGALSFYGLQQDLKYAEMLQNEALSYSKDMFNYNLQNIQALPNTLSRVSAFDINSKLYPFLEYYTCTDVEKQALRNKLIYNGMTVMTIGTIGEYLQREPMFIQGQLIRINLNDDYHVVAEIASEIHRGIYI